MSSANKKPIVTGMHHAAIRAKDFDKTIKFYTEVLGFKLRITWGKGDGRAAMIDPGDQSYIEVFAGGPQEPQPEGTIIHLAFRTDDVDAAIAAVREAGMEIIAEPQDLVIEGEVSTPIRIAFFRGPDGEVLEFFQSTGDNKL